MDEHEPTPSDLQEISALTAEIVSAYVAHHSVDSSDLPELITMVGKELAKLDQSAAEVEEEDLVPAVPIKRSVTPDYIVCLEDGRKMKMLKRYLEIRYGMTPDEYRQRWGLKDDYPMVAPGYAAQRRALAKKIGLGQKPAPQKPTRAPRKRTTRKPPAKKD